MSDADINPCPSHDVNVTVTGRGTPQPDNTSNDLLLRADNHTGCRRLRHIIDEPDLVHTHTLISNPVDNVNYACHVHNSTGTQQTLRSSGITYNVCKANTHRGKSLFDRGANGVICGDDVRVISLSDRTLNVTGIDDHEMCNLRIGSFGGVIPTQMGNVIAILNQSAYHPAGKSIISCIQVEDNGVKVDDTSIAHGGGQRVVTPEGYIIPLDSHCGLMHVPIRPFTDTEWETMPHVILTRDIPWDPSRYDRVLSDDRKWISQQAAEITTHAGFDAHGDYTDGEIYTTLAIQTARMQPAILSQTRQDVRLAADLNNLEGHVYDIDMNPPDYEAERVFFLNAPTEVVRHTRRATTQYYRNVASPGRIIDYRRTTYPAANTPRRNEQVATDTVFCDVTAWGGGATCAQVFVGRKSRFIQVYGMASDAQFVNTLNDVIRTSGAMDMLTNDRAQAEVSKRVKDVLRSYVIKDWQSEPHQQQQNYAERIYQDVKKNTNWVLNWSGAPAETWLWAFEYVAYIMNRTARQSLNWRTPYEALYGQTPDVSIMLTFVFWELCYIRNYQAGSKNFPSESNEIPVRVVGFSESVGHSITYKVYNEETGALLYRSHLRKINRGADINSRVSPTPPDDPGPPPDSSPNDPDIDPIVRSCFDSRPSSFGFDPTPLIGRHYLTTEESGERLKGEIVDYVGNFEDELEGNKIRRRFKVKVGDKVFEDMIGYQDMCDFVESACANDNGTFNMQRIIGHRTKGRIIQVLVQWESGECTYEPLSNIYSGSKQIVVEYAEANGLLDKWSTKTRDLNKDARQQGKIMRLRTNVLRIRCNRAQIKYQYGHQVPRNQAEALRLDRMHDNNLWFESIRKEIGQLLEYEAFIDYGHRSTTLPPEGYKLIPLTLVFAVKHDERYKSRLVAGGHLTDTPVESVYSGVVSLRGVRLVIFLAELNGLKVWQTDVGNAYLEAKTTEKVYAIAGPEFGEKEGHILVVNKALYGLKTSGKRWHERFADVLREMGFIPCKAEPDIWLRDRGTHYEYIAVYCDDLTIASTDPESITYELEHKYKFKLKGTGELNFLLGCDYFRDEDGTLCMGPKKYILKMKETYARLFGCNPREYQSPLEPNDNPELDTSELLQDDDIKLFQSLIGQAQWVIQVGRFDINVHVMSLSSFRMAPRQGHLDRIKRIYGYCWKFKDAAIRIRTGMPDFSDLEYAKVDWSKTPYAGAKEETPGNIPPPRGKAVKLWAYHDANLCHNKLNGKAVTAVLHFINQTPFDWFSKLQSVVNTATYGAEATAGRTAIEQMKSNKLTLQYMGVRIIGPSVLFGDNKTVVNASSVPEARLHKRHLMLSYHYVRETLATGEYVCAFVNGKNNPSDILSKHWAHNDVWPLLRAMLFWRGDTVDILKQCDASEYT